MDRPHPDWIIPDWPAPPRIRAFVTTRAGGVSRGVYASLNLGLHTGDDPRAVAANRERLCASLPQAPRWLRQVHGSTVVEADAVTDPPEADAAIARHPGRVCAVMIADCIPVLLTNRTGTVCAVAHAGWRGLASGVVEEVVQRLPGPPAELLAWLGPGIGASAFEVGDDVREAFLARHAESEAAFAPHRPGKWLADLFLLARQQMHRAGVGEIYGGDHCTFSDAKRFFSFRRDHTTGRMAAVIWREA
jgi:polyphenol oxidase